MREKEFSEVPNYLNEFKQFGRFICSIFIAARGALRSLPKNVLAVEETSRA